MTPPLKPYKSLEIDGTKFCPQFKLEIYETGATYETSEIEHGTGWYHITFAYRSQLQVLHAVKYRTGTFTTSNFLSCIGISNFI